MARTKQTAPTQVENVTEQGNKQDYSKMTAVELKKILDARKIEGRSKLTKKETMIKVLELFDQNPEDKASIIALVAELSTPRKSKTASKSEMEQVTEQVSEQKGNSEEETTKQPSSEEKPKRKSKSKKEATAESSGEEKPKGKSKSKKEATTESSSEEKPKGKSKSKKEATTESSGEEKPKGKSKSKKQKERDELLEKEGINREEYPKGTRFVISKTGKVQVRYPKDYKVEDSEDEQTPISSEKETTSDRSVNIEEPQSEDPEATQKMSEEEKSNIEESTIPSKEKKNAKTLPGAVKVLPDIPMKEGKKEVEPEPEPTAHQPEVTDLEDDPSMQEVFSLTRDLLRRMKYLAREAHENEDFKKSWVNTLIKLRDDFDDQLGLLGATIDE